MAISIPGLSLSILRQQTSVQTGLPLLISGRFTAFGLGVPAFIRVFLEGPSYNPQVRSFNTFASPFSGDFSTNVIAEKDGRYTVYAQAFPPPILPTGPPFPDAMLLLPPIAESTRPPLVVGYPYDGGVDALMPDGTTQRLDNPPMQPIEFRPVISVGAPGVTISIPGMPGGVTIPTIPFFPPPAPPAPLPTPPVPTPEPGVAPAFATIDDIQFTPTTINPGQDATGIMSWRNTGTASATYDIVLFLLSPLGITLGPLQVELNVTASPNVPMILNVRLNTLGLLPGLYGVLAEIYESATGIRLSTRSFPAKVEIREVGVPEPPVPPEIPAPPLPTREILGTPTVNLPAQITVGQVLSGNVSLPTTAPVPYFLDTRLLLQSPTGQEIPITQLGGIIQPGQPIDLAVNLNTTGFEPGDYGILLRVLDETGMAIMEFPLGLLSMLAGLVPPVPEVPTLPTADMFRTPILNLPMSVEYGEIWQGDITIPTIVPPWLEQLIPGLPTGMPGLPQFPVNIGLQLQSPDGQLFNVGSFSPSFTPGDDINLPLSFDTSQLPGQGVQNIIMNIEDLQGNQLFSNIIGMLDVLPIPELPPVPELPPPPGLPSEFPSIVVNLGPSEVGVGDVLVVPVTYTHIGPPETVTLYAAIGEDRVTIFDEVLHGEKRITVPLDVAPTPRNDTIEIAITSRLAGGIYDVYAKVDGLIPRAITPTLNNIVTMIGPPAPLVPLPSVFTSISVQLTLQRVEWGDVLQVPVSYIHVGAAQNVVLYAAIGEERVTIFDEVLYGQKTVSVPQDASPTPGGDIVEIPITTALSPGVYDVYAKVAGIFPERVSATLHNVIELVGPPELGPSQFPSIAVQISAQDVVVGDVVRVPVRYTHVGREESVRLYAAIGNWGTFGFNEVLNAQKWISVPGDSVSQARDDFIDIPITAALSPGRYDVYAKIGHIGVETISPVVHDVIRLAAPPAPPPAPPPIGRSRFSNVQVVWAGGTFNQGETVSVPVNYTHEGASQRATLYAAIGNWGAFGFNEIVHGEVAISAPDDTQPVTRRGRVSVPLTAAISPGTYDVYAKITGIYPEAISPPVQNIVRVVSVAPPPPAPPPPGEFTLLTKAAPLAGGWVTKEPDKALYSEGEIVRCTAHPAPGRSFNYWTLETGEYMGSQSPISFMVMASHTLTAHF